MKRFIIEQSDQEFYTSHSGLALMGLALNRHRELTQALKAAIPQRHGISHSDIAKSYLHQLCLARTISKRSATRVMTYSSGKH